MIKVKDADTYVLLMHGKQINCRLANVDAPELKQKWGVNSKEGF